MRVALDAGPLLHPGTGVGRYTRHLSQALRALGVDVLEYAFAWGGDPPPEVARMRVPARLVRTMWRPFRWPRAQTLVGATDVVHGTNFVIPPLGGAAGVVTVHDLSFLDETWFSGAGQLKLLVPWSIRRAGAVIVPTEAIASEVVSRYQIRSDRIVVTPEGVAPVFFGATPLSDGALAGMGISRPFALAIASDAPRKNLSRLVEAWNAAGLSGWTLAVAGTRAPAGPGVSALGWIGDETLPGLVAAAEIFCYPSLYEGFGLPPLEAMAAGTPCLVGRYSAAPEVLGDAALLVDARDVGALAQGLRQLAGDEALRRRLARAGRARAARFTWESTARATLKAYQNARNRGY